MWAGFRGKKEAISDPSEIGARGAFHGASK